MAMKSWWLMADGTPRAAPRESAIAVRQTSSCFFPIGEVQMARIDSATEQGQGSTRRLSVFVWSRSR